MEAMMPYRELPILFSGPMVQAILRDLKTQTRRIIHPQPPAWCDSAGLSALTPAGKWEFRGQHPTLGASASFIRCPYLPVSETRLWVRETWCLLDRDHWADDRKPKDWLYNGPNPRRNACAYRAETGADGERCRIESGYQWRPSIHMPRWASRLALKPVCVRAERLQAITEEDAIAEGCRARSYRDGRGEESARHVFRELWDSINARRGYSWEKDPWVWVISFTRSEEA